MSEVKSMRIVPSGKIYRQMFEAQVYNTFFILADLKQM